MAPGATRTDETGFTLLELMVAILVLAVLTVIAIPTFFSVQASAVDGVAQADLRNAKTAVVLYLNEHGGSFPSIASLEADGFSPSEGVDEWYIEGSADGYCIEAFSGNGRAFNVRDDHGVTAGEC
jgi:prepilin-type N-terminal cleavage/methylation domain-containing protein